MCCRNKALRASRPQKSQILFLSISLLKSEMPDDLWLAPKWIRSKCFAIHVVNSLIIGFYAKNLCKTWVLEVFQWTDIKTHIAQPWAFSKKLLFFFSHKYEKFLDDKSIWKQRIGHRMIDVRKQAESVEKRELLRLSAPFSLQPPSGSRAATVNWNVHNVRIEQ